jgi:hypothetical protein
MKTKQRLTNLQKEWLKALRSGRYKQTKEELCNENTGGYCFLGVAARVCGIPKKKLIGIGDLEDADYLHSVTKNMRLRNGLGAFKVIRLNTPSLICMNDSDELSFDEIADYIEQNPENVFLPPKKRAKKS